MFVASHYTPWHGLDLVIEKLKKQSGSFVLHVVGPMSENNNEKDKRIVYHGVKDRSYIIDLMAECDVGLGSFALNRIGMNEACHLKVREYLAAGLPVYSSFKDAGFPQDFPYYKLGELNLDSMLDFASESRKLSRQQVRKSAAKYIDKTNLMANLIEWLKSVS